MRRWTAPRACAACSRPFSNRRAVRRLPQEHGAAQRGCRDGPGADQRARVGRLIEHLLVPIAVGWWRSRRHRPPGGRGADEPADRPPARGCEGHDDAARAPSERDPHQPAVAAACSPSWRRPRVPRASDPRHPAGFAIIWALAWRQQDAAVAAIEERDGAAFYVQRTSPVRPDVAGSHARLQRARPERANGAVS